MSLGKVTLEKIWLASYHSGWHNQTIMLRTLNLYSDIDQLFFNKAGGERYFLMEQMNEHTDK